MVVGFVMDSYIGKPDILCKSNAVFKALYRAHGHS